MKRIFDFFASLFGMIILLPALLIIALLIKIRMPGPALFRQERTGRFGKPFTILKFRSLAPGPISLNIRTGCRERSLRSLNSAPV